jgi:hypothetical protein
MPNVNGMKFPYTPMGMKQAELMKRKMMMTAKIGKELKEVPANNKGLSKLPTSVRNKMGYAKYGTSVKKPRTMKEYYGGGSPSMDKRGRRIPGMFDGMM